MGGRVVAAQSRRSGRHPRRDDAPQRRHRLGETRPRSDESQRREFRVAIGPAAAEVRNSSTSRGSPRLGAAPAPRCGSGRRGRAPCDTRRTGGSIRPRHVDRRARRGRAVAVAHVAGRPRSFRATHSRLAIRVSRHLASQAHYCLRLAGRTRAWRIVANGLPVCGATRPTSSDVSAEMPWRGCQRCAGISAVGDVFVSTRASRPNSGR
jgi:hypothetical protein